MAERRTQSRRRTFKAGTIALIGGGVINTTVRNLTDGGAMLEVPTVVGIPDEFNLVIQADQFSGRCKVEWRQATKLSVRFL